LCGDGKINFVEKIMSILIKHIVIVVEDYDKAIEFYTQKLNFVLLEDTKLTDEKRWVIVSPPNSECSLILAKASTDEQKTRIGNQTGGRVFLFLNTNNFEEAHQNLMDKNVTIIREPKVEKYGKVLVFADLYGNMWDLIEPTK
jgi:catechol 2,3-dioxygenase-like lactoylglutathione lyase family enzyme